jgi:type IV pilus assembly protein PilY1
VGVSVLGICAWPASGRAQQIDTNPPTPNVLLLLDNSGSMERMIDGSIPESSPANACNCDPSANTCNWAVSPNPNRWGTVQQALTGQLANGFNCAAMPRTPGSTFASEYQIGGVTPYDINYYLAFHRVIAKDTSSGTPVPCVIAPGVLPGALANQGVGPSGSGTGPSVSADAFVTGDVVARPYGALTTTTTSCQFAQLPNGALTSMTDLMRFGLMTFDEDPSPAIGVVNTGAGFQVASPAFPGMWSYFPGWDSNGTCPYLGYPMNCKTSTIQGLGARNPAAPPWEGRMVRFPSTGNISTQEQNNSNIADVIRASRPYGATPLAGMLTGAQYYFWNDPTGPQGTDVFVQGDCRPEYIIILTDGQPNDDMRPDCNAAVGAGETPGHCPFSLPEDIAAALYNNGQPNASNQSVKTYVIGFAVSKFDDSGSIVNCASLVSNGNLSSACATGDANYAPCCELQKIALNGGSGQAYFADTPGDLQGALGSILADISKQATTRATPAYSPVVTNVVADTTGQTPNQEIFYASFTPSAAGPWSGDIQRSRYFCPTGSSSGSSSPSSSSSSSSTSTPTGFNPSQGDDFATDLNTNAPARTFIVYEPGAISGQSGSQSARGTIRPYVQSSVTDGVSTNGASMYAGSAANVIPQITPDVLNIPMTGATAGCPYSPNNAVGTQYLDPLTCRNMVLDFAFGQPSSAFTGPGNFTFMPRYGNAFGDIYHASPIVVGPPGSLLQDPSYQAFRQGCASGQCGTAPSGSGSASSSSSSGGSTGSQRPTVVYAATNDGLLHAFWADETAAANNELWAMLLPEAMPSLLSSYPSSHEFLLDGSPVVKDVVWDRSTTTNTASAWHTTLVAGFGPYAQGYYAVDVTDPSPAQIMAGASAVANPPPAGPALRWQLSTLEPGSSNFQILGNFSAKPAITTLFMDPGDGNQREIGVAILPGGWDGLPSGSSPVACARSTKTPAQIETPATGYATRTAVRCWGTTNNPQPTDPVDGRTVSVVRLDTGEVLAVFGRKADFPSTAGTFNVARVIDTPLDSPMTGTPIVYPTDVGSDATKVFVSDADGTIWRFDLSSPIPANWTGGLFLDLYNQTVDTSTTSWQDGQPLGVDPVLSLDPAGELVLDVATGTTQAFDSTGIYYVYSITEQLTASGPAANVNWYFGANSSPSGSPTSALRAGERVAGPMTVFNGTLYFATYFSGTPASLSCTSGDARIWGMDFVTPYGGASCTANPDPCRGNGGVFAASVSSSTGYIDVGATNPGKVVPGLTVQTTPACGTLTAGLDSYAAGATHYSTAGFTAGQFSVVGLIGGVSAANGLSTAQVQVPLQTPMSPTLIDSWAAVLE